MLSKPLHFQVYPKDTYNRLGFEVVMIIKTIIVII